MNALITIVRLPLGIIAIVIISIFWCLMFPLESLVVLISLPFLSVVMNRTQIKESWVARYPVSLKKIAEKRQLIWNWIVDDY